MSEEIKEEKRFPFKKRDKLCIVGCADTKHETPFHQPDQFEFWGVNNLYLTLPGKPWSRWFEIHQITLEDGLWLRRKKPEFRGMPVDQYLKGLGKLPCPVYMQQANPLVPNAVQYPLSEIMACYGTYFTNSVSYMIALGILEEFQEIRVYGVDMAVDTEYFWQRPSCEYFLGIALGKGIKIYLPPAADLLKNRFMYGYDEYRSLPYEEKINNTMKSLEMKRRQATEQKLFAQKQEDQYTGALLFAAEHKKVWKNVTGG